MSDISAQSIGQNLQIPAVLDLESRTVLEGFSLNMSKIREAELRLIEAKTVNPITYSDLEHSFNESYRDLKRHLASIGFALAKANQRLEDVKATLLLDLYPDFIVAQAAAGKKLSDTADIRKAFMTRSPDFRATTDRIDQLIALESNLDGKLKVMENVCRYMRKQMDLVLRSGLTGKDLYSSIGKK